MTIHGSGIPFIYPARTFVISGSVVHPVAPFVHALKKGRFRVKSGQGAGPVRLRYGTYLKSVLTSEYVPTMILPEVLGRWELMVSVLVTSEVDQHGNHAVTITSNSSPRRGNDLVFKLVAKAADAFARDGHLLHWTDYFQGDINAMKGRAPKKQAQSRRGSGNPSDT